MHKKSISTVQIRMVDSKIMNQLSYDVLSERIADKGFNCRDDIEKVIRETISMFAALMR